MRLEEKRIEMRERHVPLNPQPKNHCYYQQGRSHVHGWGAIPPPPPILKFSYIYMVTKCIWKKFSSPKVPISTLTKDKLHGKPAWVCHFCGKSRHIRPNCYKLQAAKRANKPKVHVPQVQDPMVLIGELVKALNLYSNPRVGNYSHVNKNSNAWGASKKFWMQKAQFKWVFLTWSLCFFALLFVTIVIFLLFYFVSGLALHNIHAFHSTTVFVSYFQNKKGGGWGEGKGKQILFCIFSWIWNLGWPI